MAINPASPSDLLSTPEGYATPEQVRHARMFYDQMLQQGTDLSPIQSKAQGWARMVQALVGGLGSYNTSKNEATRLAAAGGKVVPSGVGEDGVPQPPRLPGIPSAPALGYATTPGGIKAQVSQSAQPAFTGFLRDLEEAGAPIKSAGGYNPRYIAGTHTPSQHAFGNAIDIDQSGRNISSPEFTAWAKANPDKMQAITQKWGIKSGGDFKNPDFGHFELPGGRAPGGVIPGPQSALPGADGGQALAFNGEPTNMPQVGAPDPMASALAGPGGYPMPGGGGAGGPPLPRTFPTQPGGTTSPNAMIPPGVLPMRPRYSTEQIKSILGDPYVPQTTKDMALQLYMQQNQPVEMQTMGGKVIVGRDGTQYRVPDVKWTRQKSGAAETDVPAIVNDQQQYQELVPQGGPPARQQQTLPNIPGLPYNSPNAGKAEYGKGIQNDLPPLPPEITMGPEAAKAMRGQPGAVPSMDAERPAPLPPNPPPDTTHGIDRSLKGDSLNAAPGGGPLQYAPPEGGDVTLPRAGTEGKTAQAGGTPPVGSIPGMSPTMQRLQQQSLDYEGKKHAQEKEIDEYQKQIDSTVSAGQRAQSSRPLLEMARKLVDNEKYYSGIGNAAVLDWKKVKAAAGFDPNAAAAMEIFTKVISGQLLEDMKNLQGLGQIRVAEIQLLQKAAGNLDMTDPANRVVLDLMIKAHDRAAMIGKIANNYQGGMRPGKDGKAIRDKDGNIAVMNTPPKQSELNGFINSYLDANPILTQAEQAQISKLLEGKHGYGAPGQEKYSKYKRGQSQPTETPEPPAEPKTYTLEPPPFGRK